MRALQGQDLAPIGRIDLGDDADNVRVDEARNRVLVGYGRGSLAVIDPVGLSKTADIRLKAHPEGFQIDETGTQAFVNVPDAREISVVDLATGATRSLPTQGAGSNFPMAINGAAHRVLVVFRSPPTLMALSSQDGHVMANSETCRDADDVFVDRKRGRVYVSCGQGVVDVLEGDEAGYRRLARVPTVPGARTSLYGPELDRLFVAVRAGSNEPAAIWMFDCGGSERIGGFGEFHPEALHRLKLSGLADQHLGKVGVNSPIAGFVRVGQRRAPNRFAEPHVIKLGGLGR